MNNALKAIAKLTGIDLNVAAATTRRQPLFDEEIHIDEELINLQETFWSMQRGRDTLKNYPRMLRHAVHEQEQIMKHCIGQVVRMARGQRMSRDYSQKDTTYAMTKLVRILMSEAMRSKQTIEDDVLEAIRPYLSIRQRLMLREWSSFSPRLQAQLALRRLTALAQIG